MRRSVQGLWRGRVGRDLGASGSRKCRREGELFHGEDMGRVGAGKKTKLGEGHPVGWRTEQGSRGREESGQAGGRGQGKEGKQGGSPAAAFVPV